jgi:hypothetical protein
VTLLARSEDDIDEDDEEEEEEDEDEQIDFVLGGVSARLLFGERLLLEVDRDEWSLLVCGDTAADEDVGDIGIECWPKKGCDGVLALPGGASLGALPGYRCWNGECGPFG